MSAVTALTIVSFLLVYTTVKAVKATIRGAKRFANRKWA